MNQTRTIKLKEMPRTRYLPLPNGMYLTEMFIEGEWRIIDNIPAKSYRQKLELIINSEHEFWREALKKSDRDFKWIFLPLLFIAALFLGK